MRFLTAISGRVTIALKLVLMSYLSLLAATGNIASSADKPTTTTETAMPPRQRVIDVTIADGIYVKEPLIRRDTHDPAIARLNSERIQAIMQGGSIADHCKIYFPAGIYYFDGAPEGQTATIQSTAMFQTFAGDGPNATQIRQASKDVEATFRIGHTGGTIRDLSISSIDYSDTYQSDWDANPLQSAIHMVAPDTWLMDPQVVNVNVNSTGNHFAVEGYYRPFERAMRFDGPWLNIYVHTMFIQHVHNAIYINQGKLIAGPAKFIDVNSYATAPSGSKRWNVFFKSEGHLMEQVELIHCTYIGSQFIYMDGSLPSPSTNPVYNMIIDHNYINTLWLDDVEEYKHDPRWSGIYMNLPPDPKKENYSKKIIFTNNTCGGKAPSRGAFFYVEGILKGLTISGNDLASGGADKCFYIRATTPIDASNVSIRDIEITNNYFNDFRNPITIGGDMADPSRRDFDSHPSPETEHISKRRDAYVGKDDDPYYIEGVLISGNQTFNLPQINKGLLTSCYINKARRININGNSFTNTDGHGFVFNECQDITMTGNNYSGFGPDHSRNGLILSKCKDVLIASNSLFGFKQAITASDSRNVSFTGNRLGNSGVGVALRGVDAFSLTGNQLHDCSVSLQLQGSRNGTVNGNNAINANTPLKLESGQDIVFGGNLLRGKNPPELKNDNQGIVTSDNIGLDLESTPSK